MILLILYVFLFFTSIYFNGVLYAKTMESYNFGYTSFALLCLLLQASCFVGTIFSAVYSVKQFLLVIQ